MKTNGRRGMESLREVFSPAMLRALAGIVDAGQVFLAAIGAPESDDPAQSDGRDVFVRVRDVLTEHPLTARLFVPMNILWRKPRADETCMVLEPRDANAPGAPYALYGDAGHEDAVPAWFGEKAGLHAPETVRVESKTGDVELEVTGSGKKVKLGASASKAVNREGDPIRPGSLSFAVGTPVPAGPATTVPLTITYQEPDGGATHVVVLNFTGVGLAIAPVGGTSITLAGKTGAGSSKVKAED